MWEAYGSKVQARKRVEERLAHARAARIRQRQKYVGTSITYTDMRFSCSTCCNNVLFALMFLFAGPLLLVLRLDTITTSPWSVVMTPYWLAQVGVTLEAIPLSCILVFTFFRGLYHGLSFYETCQVF